MNKTFRCRHVTKFNTPSYWRPKELLVAHCIGILFICASRLLNSSSYSICCNVFYCKLPVIKLTVQKS